MKTKSKIQVALIIVICSLLTITNMNAQQEKYLAAFIYQFTNYITWPSASGEFIIGVIGNTPVISHLQELAKEKKVGASSIVIKEWASVGDIGQCKILFIPESQKANLASIKSKVEGKPVLIITESPGLTKSGAGISFVKQEGKIRFEIHKTNLAKIGVIVSDGLARLALNVY
jgi:roadblock/LC7 domain-containing protein